MEGNNGILTIKNSKYSTIRMSTKRGTTKLNILVLILSTILILSTRRETTEFKMNSIYSYYMWTKGGNNNIRE